MEGAELGLSPLVALVAAARREVKKGRKERDDIRSIECVGPTMEKYGMGILMGVYASRGTYLIDCGNDGGCLCTLRAENFYAHVTITY